MAEDTSAEAIGSRANGALNVVAGWIEQEESGFSLMSDKTDLQINVYLFDSFI